jgi:hypothetical protein
MFKGGYLNLCIFVTMVYDNYKKQIQDSGFLTINNVFSDVEVKEILRLIDQADTSKKTFRKTTDLFAIRQFFKGSTRPK